MFEKPCGFGAVVVESSWQSDEAGEIENFVVDWVEWIVEWPLRNAWVLGIVRMGI